MFLDRAVPNHLTDVFKDSQKVWCPEHMQKKDRVKLQNMCAGQRNSDRIKAEIYGSQNNVLFQTGLADAINKDDFMANLNHYARHKTTKDIIDVVGCHRWFKRKRASLFIESVILSSRKNAGIEGQFYTKGLKLKHRLH